MLITIPRNSTRQQIYVGLTLGFCSSIFSDWKRSSFYREHEGLVVDDVWSAIEHETINIWGLIKEDNYARGHAWANWGQESDPICGPGLMDSVIPAQLGFRLSDREMTAWPSGYHTSHQCIQLVGGRLGVKRGDYIALVFASLNGFVGITGTVCNADCGLDSHCLVRRQDWGLPRGHDNNVRLWRY